MLFYGKLPALFFLIYRKKMEFFAKEVFYLLFYIFREKWR